MTGGPGRLCPARCFRRKMTKAGGTLVTRRVVTLVTFLFGNSGFNLLSL